MKLTKKDRKKIVKDYLGYVPLTFTKLDLESLEYIPSLAESMSENNKISSYKRRL